MTRFWHPWSLMIAAFRVFFFVFFRGGVRVYSNTNFFFVISAKLWLFISYWQCAIELLLKTRIEINDLNRMSNLKTLKKIVLLFENLPSIMFILILTVKLY